MAAVQSRWEDWSPAQQNRTSRATWHFARRAQLDPDLWARVQERKEQLRREGRLPPEEPLPEAASF